MNKNINLTDYLIDLKLSNPVSFHMPGHKGRSTLYGIYGFGDFTRQIIGSDITELPGADALQQPRGVIRKIMNGYAELYGAVKTELLVNGSSAGLMAAVMGSVPRGKKLLMGRNSHRSVYGALRLGGIEPVYIMPELDDETGLELGLDPAKVEAALMRDPDIAAVLVTSPNYYGVLSDIERIANIAHLHNRILIVDQAHGAHLKFFDYLTADCSKKLIGNSNAKNQNPRHNLILDPDSKTQSTEPGIVHAKLVADFVASNPARTQNQNLESASNSRRWFHKSNASSNQAHSQSAKVNSNHNPDPTQNSNFNIRDMNQKSAIKSKELWSLNQNFNTENQRPRAAENCGADLVVDSTHKTLLSFTGSAILNICTERPDQDRIGELLRMLQTTSPSYLLMGSLDVNQQILHMDGYNLIKRWNDDIQYFYSEAAKIPNLELIERPDMDLTKINISLAKLGLSGDELAAELQKRNIWIELTHGDFAMMMTGIGNERGDYEELLTALREISAEYSSTDSENITEIDLHIPKTDENQTETTNLATKFPSESTISARMSTKPITKATIFTIGPTNSAETSPKSGEKATTTTEISTISTLNQAKCSEIPTEPLDQRSIPDQYESVPLYEAEGRVLYESLIPYPPGSPIACPGEVLSNEVIRFVEDQLMKNHTVIGVDEEGEIKVAR